MACSVICITKYVLFVIFCFTLPLYVIILYSLVKRGKTTFKSSFFKFFVSLGIVDIVRMLDVYFYLKAVRWRWYNWLFISFPTLIPTVLHVIRWQCFFAQMFGVLLLTLNRYVGIVHPMNLETIFTPQNTKNMIVAKWLISTILILPRPLMTQRLVYRPDNETLRMAWVSAEHGQFGWNGVYHKIGSLSNFVVAVIAIALYSRMIYCVCVNSHHVSQLHNAQRDNGPNAELRLACVGIVIGLTYSAYGIVGFSLGFLGISARYKPLLQLYLSFVIDVVNGVNPYALILLCENVRIEVRDTLTCGSGQTSVTEIRNSPPRSTGRLIRRDNPRVIVLESRL